MKLLNNSQLEQLQEIATQLQQARQERSLRIEEIAAHTRIRLAFLQALEEGKFEDLPEPVYVKGFIRHYGDAVGLNGNALARSFESTFAVPKAEDEGQKIQDSKSGVHMPLVVPYIFLLASASLGLFYMLNLQHSSELISPSSSTPNTVEPTTEPSPLASIPVKSLPTDTPSSSISSITSDVEITLELQDTSWLRVQVDGKTEFEGTLNKGERKTWTAKEEITIRSGNAGAVLVSANNQEARPLGNMGSVKQVTFTPQNLSQPLAQQTQSSEN